MHVHSQPSSNSISNTKNPSEQDVVIGQGLGRNISVLDESQKVTEKLIPKANLIGGIVKSTFSDDFIVEEKDTNFKANHILLGYENIKTRRDEIKAAFIKKLEEFVLNDELPIENILRINEDKSLQKAGDIEDIDELKNAKYIIGFVIAGIKYVAANDEAESEEIEKNNPGIIAVPTPKNLQPQLNQILQKSIENYIAYRLNLAKDEDKEKEQQELHLHLSQSTSQYIPNTNPSFSTVKSETKLLNTSPQLILQTVITVESIIKANRKEEKEKATREENIRIEEQEIHRGIQREEIKNEDIQKIDKRQNQVKSDINSTLGKQ